MKIIFYIPLVLLLCLYSCYEYPNQSDIQYEKDIKFCKDNERIDIGSLTDSNGLNLRSFQQVDDKGEYLNGKKTGLWVIQRKFDKSWLNYELNGYAIRQETRVYSNFKPFTGKAKSCKDSVEVELAWGNTMWVNKKAVVEYEMAFVDGWLDGECIGYEYQLDDDWKKLIIYSQRNSTFKNGFLHGPYSYGGHAIDGNYKNGLKDGVWKEFDEKGEYLNGKKTGLWVIQRNDEGRQYVDKINYENGNRVDRTTYLNGKEVEKNTY